MQRIAGGPYAGGVLVIRADLVDEIVAHARRDHPNEACGVVAGPEGSDRPERFVPMLNAAALPDVLRVRLEGPARLLYRELDDRGEVPVVIYHSHTATEAFPSLIDIGLAQEPFAHYVWSRPRDPDSHEFRSFRIVDGVVTRKTWTSWRVTCSRTPARTTSPTGPDAR